MKLGFRESLSVFVQNVYFIDDICGNFAAGEADKFSETGAIII